MIKRTRAVRNGLCFRLDFILLFRCRSLMLILKLGNGINNVKSQKNCNGLFFLHYLIVDFWHVSRAILISRKYFGKQWNPRHPEVRQPSCRLKLISVSLKDFDSRIEVVEWVILRYKWKKHHFNFSKSSVISISHFFSRVFDEVCSSASIFPALALFFFARYNV